MKVWIEDKKFRHIANETIAEYIVRAYLHHEMGRDASPETELETAIVWQSYILGYRKYLITTLDPGDDLFRRHSLDQGTHTLRIAMTPSDERRFGYFTVFDRQSNHFRTYSTLRYVLNTFCSHIFFL